MSINYATNQGPDNLVNPQIYSRIKAKFDQMTEGQMKKLEESMSWFFLSDNIKKKTREQIQNRMKKMDLISIFLATVGMLCNIMASFLYIDFAKIEKGGIMLNNYRYNIYNCGYLSIY